MNIFKKLFNWGKSTLSKPPGLPDTWRDLEDSEKFDWIVKKGCLVCLENPTFKVSMGPSGGLSQNVWCTVCGTRWNMTVFSSTQGRAELIRENEDKERLKDAVEDIEEEAITSPVRR